MEAIFAIGTFVQEWVLKGASLLKNPASPGFVSLLLFVIFVGVVWWFWQSTKAQLNAIQWLTDLIRGQDEGFSKTIDALTATVNSEASTKQREALASAWRNYRQTLVPYEHDDEIIYRSSLRAAQFLSPEELGFSAGFWRIVPGLFVSVGLFLTFVGLVAALDSMAGESIGSETMAALLSIASAKFIMSLTGLLLSIFFTLFLRWRLWRIDNAAHQLCTDIDERLTFISLEELAAEQLSATREQREHFRKIGLELVAELGRPLREELPATISSSISGAIAPLIERVQQTGVENINGMVKDLSTQFSEEVGAALATASNRLVEAGDKISELTERMDRSSGQMGAEMESAIARLSQAVDDLRSTMKLAAEDAGGAFAQGAEHLLAAMNNTLEGIKANTAEGARAMSDAAQAMVEAAGSVRTEMEGAAKEAGKLATEGVGSVAIAAGSAIETAGRGVMSALESTTDEVTQVASDVSHKVTHDVLVPLSQMAEQLHETVATLKSGTAELRHMSDGVRAGADASAKAASSFRTASEDLVSAVAPIRSTSASIESSIRQLSDSTASTAQTVTKSAELVAQSASEALASAEEILGHKSKSIEATLALVEQMLARLRGQGDRLDDMDEKLGRAFEAYNTQVEAAVSSMRDHVTGLQRELQPALETLREVVDRAEEFIPQSRSV